MTQNLTGNPYAERAEELAAAAESKAKVKDFERATAFAAAGATYAQLASAYEQRTTTLAMLHRGNHEAAIRLHGPSLESAPPELMDFLNEKHIELAERLGVSA